MADIYKIIEIRAHYERESNDPVAIICDFLIEQFVPYEPIVITESENNGDQS